MFYIHTNAQGAPEWMTDSEQQTAWQASYLPFGEISVEKEQENLNLRFQGQYHDQESDLYYNDHRYYQPKWGRYITADPSGLNGGMNRYAYANANPVMFIDPLGLSPCGVAREDAPTADGFLEQLKLDAADGGVLGFLQFFAANSGQLLIEGLDRSGIDSLIDLDISEFNEQRANGDGAFDAAKKTSGLVGGATDAVEKASNGDVLGAAGVVVVTVAKKTPAGKVIDKATQGLSLIHI